MRKLLGIASVMVLASAAQASIIFADDFESYADTAAMNAPGAWGDNGAGQTGTLVTSGGNPGQYANQPGLKAGQHNFGAPIDLDDGPIIWEADIIDDGVGNKRITTALRGAGTNNWWELGRHNAMAHPESGVLGGTVAGYGIRTVFNSGQTVPPSALTSGGWIALNNALNQPVLAAAGTHHLRATITNTGALFEIDLNSDGSIDGSRAMTTTDQGANPFIMVRMGGPSDVSSAGGGLGFDNLVISQIPEPTSALLLVLGGLALRRRG